MRTTPFAELKSLFAMTDEQAMWRVQMHDDASAFAQLVQRWEKPIQRLCTRMIGDAHRAEDLTQEAFARLFQRRQSYQCSNKFSTYLWRIALNLCYDELRRRRHELVPLPDDEDEDATPFDRQAAPGPGPDGIALEAERATLVRKALMRLAENHRTVVVLRHYQGLKFREIAEVLGIPEGTVKSRMVDALDQLSRLLRPALDERPRPIPRPPGSPRPNERLLI
jgi:RNA polymerase sigma-70 factor (ECF subfamily)